MAVANLLVDGGASKNLTPSVKDHVNARWEPSALEALPTATRWSISMARCCPLRLCA